MAVLLEVRTQRRAELTSGQLQISGCSSSQLSSGDNTAQDTTHDHGGDAEAVLLWMQSQDRFSHHSGDMCDIVGLAPIDELYIHLQHVLQSRTLPRLRSWSNDARNSLKVTLGQSDAGRRCHHVSLGNNAACAGSASHLRHQQGRSEVGATLGSILHAPVHYRRSGDAGLLCCSLHPPRIRGRHLHSHLHNRLGKYECVFHPGGVQLLQRTAQQLRSKKNLVGASNVGNIK